MKVFLIILIWMVAASIGSAVAGKLGFFLALAPVVLLSTVPKLISRWKQKETDSSQAAIEGYHLTDNSNRPGAASVRALAVAYVGYTLLFMSYALILGAWHDQNWVLNWISLFHPAIEVLSGCFASLNLIPADLNNLGYRDWALPVQNVLFVGIIISLAMDLWILVAVFFVRNAIYDNIFPEKPRSDSIKALVVSAFVLWALTWTLFFGRLPPSWQPTFAGSLAIIFLSFLLSGTVFAFLATAVSLRRVGLNVFSDARKLPSVNRDRKNEDYYLMRRLFRRGNE